MKTPLGKKEKKKKRTSCVLLVGGGLGGGGGGVSRVGVVGEGGVERDGVRGGGGGISILRPGASRTHTHNAKRQQRQTDENHFCFRHKELGHPLIIVNHAINLSVAQMNTALGMRQSLLACYVSLTQFIPPFTQDHSYVK